MGEGLPPSVSAPYLAEPACPGLPSRDSPSSASPAFSWAIFRHDLCRDALRIKIGEAAPNPLSLGCNPRSLLLQQAAGTGGGRGVRGKDALAFLSWQPDLLEE